MRRRDHLSPEVERGLADLDAALRGDPGADPELAELAGAVRAERAEPSPAFLASLDAKVAGGFPGPARSHRARRRWVLAPAAGLAVAGALAVAVVVPGDGGDERTASSVAVEAAPGDAAPSQESAGGAATPAADSTMSTPAPPARSIAPPSAPGPETLRRDRKVERAATLGLTAEPDDVQRVADGVVRETQALGGYVQASQVATRPEGGEATFTLRLPSDRLDDGLARLSKLASVGSLTQDATDITGSFVSAEDRLSDARAERRALLRALGRADTEAEIASLRARIRLNRSEIAARKGDLEALRRRADLATVIVEVTGSETAATGEDEGGAWTPGDALDDAGRVLEVTAGVALVALAVALPLALVALLLGVGGRALRRHRREARLDAA